MAKVLIDLSMSLDGFITGPNPTKENAFGGRHAEKLHDWYFNGTTPSPHNDFFKPKGPNIEVVEELFTMTGAMVVGRKWYDIIDGWGGNHPLKGAPIFLLTHHAPAKIPQGTTPFTVVTDGMESAIRQAKAAAGEKNVTIGGANVAQQGLAAGLVDELYIHIAPILLGDGTRLFEDSGKPIELETIQVIDTPSVTHVRQRVIK